MRILFDPVTIGMRNKGNIALLQTAVNRCHKMWPNASLEVLTEAPYLLKLYCPDARPISPEQWNDGIENPTWLDTATQRIPRPLLRSLFELREEVWLRWPSIGSVLTKARLRSLFQVKSKRDDEHADRGSREEEGAKEVAARNTRRETVNGVDLFVASGAHYMSDICRDVALMVLDRLERAAQLGIPTAMVGQGLGPLDDLELRARAKAVLPLVDLIFIRDRQVAPPLLDLLGVDPTRVIYTGDDAIGMAYDARPARRGTALGVSVRTASYAKIDVHHIEMLRSVLHQATAKYRAKFIAIPISHSMHELDNRALGQILMGHSDPSYNGWRFDTPLEVIKRVGLCRLVVTGTFHTAVFALAQGIPAICFANSSHYLEKFLSVADSFGAGCQVVHVDDEHFQQKLTMAIDTAWESAEELRPQLLAAAARHIELGQAAYQRLFELVEYKDKAVQRQELHEQP